MLSDALHIKTNISLNLLIYYGATVAVCTQKVKIENNVQQEVGRIVYKWYEKPIAQTVQDTNSLGYE